jgi:hypothetical protein
MYSQPYGAPPPIHDPQASTQVYQLPHVNPNPPSRRWSPSVILAVFAVVLGAAALLIGPRIIPGNLSPAEANHLKTQVSQLQRANHDLGVEYSNLAVQYKSLSTQYSALNGTVNGMTKTVHNLAPYADAQCSAAMQGPSGAYTAAIPCKPK